MGNKMSGHDDDDMKRVKGRYAGEMLFDDEDERPQHDPAGAGVNCPGHSAGSAACRKQRAVCGPDFDRLRRGSLYIG